MTPELTVKTPRFFERDIFPYEWGDEHEDKKNRKRIPQRIRTNDLRRQCQTRQWQENTKRCGIADLYRERMRFREKLDTDKPESAAIGQQKSSPVPIVRHRQIKIPKNIKNNDAQHRQRESPYHVLKFPSRKPECVSNQYNDSFSRLISTVRPLRHSRQVSKHSTLILAFAFILVSDNFYARFPPSRYGIWDAWFGINDKYVFKYVAELILNSYRYNQKIPLLDYTAMNFSR